MPISHFLSEEKVEEKVAKQRVSMDTGNNTEKSEKTRRKEEIDTRKLSPMKYLENANNMTNDFFLWKFVNLYDDDAFFSG